MSVWVLHGVSLPEARAADMLLRLPLGEEEDFTDAVSMPELRQRLKARHPEAPPERINIMAEGMWRFTHGIGVEDILAMPQPEEEMVAFAQATGAVRYVAEEGGAGHYALPVRLFAARVPVEKFGRRAEVFTRRRHALHEVHDAQARAAIRDCLPLSANRFARWKWILPIIATLQFFYFVLQLWRRQRGF